MGPESVDADSVASFRIGYLSELRARSCWADRKVADGKAGRKITADLPEVQAGIATIRH